MSLRQPDPDGVVEAYHWLIDEHGSPEAVEQQLIKRRQEAVRRRDDEEIAKINNRLAIIRRRMTNV